MAPLAWAAQIRQIPFAVKGTWHREAADELIDECLKVPCGAEMTNQLPVRLGTDCSGMETPLMALRALGINTEHVFSSDIDKHAAGQT